MEQLALKDFVDTVGQPYRLDDSDAPYELVLESAAALPGSAREGGAFRLEFRGPAGSVLPQATYTLRRHNRSHDIFIVPIGHDDRGAVYEAIFY